MGVGVLYSAITGLILLIWSPVSFFILKKHGHKKWAIVVATILALIVVIPLLSIAFEGAFYNNRDVKEDLKIANLKLNDHFDIISNKVTGMPERVQITAIRLTKKDRNRIISEIKNGVDFKESGNTRILQNEMWDEKNVRNKVVFTDYHWQNEYFRESYYRQDNYIPTLMIVSLKENSDTLTFERIEE